MTARAYQRLKEKRAKCMGTEFGEAVRWRTGSAGGRFGKLSSMWRRGEYLSFRAKSREIIVKDERGTWKTRAVLRKPKGERWAIASADLVKLYPRSK